MAYTLLSEISIAFEKNPDMQVYAFMFSLRHRGVYETRLFYRIRSYSVENPAL